MLEDTSAVSLMINRCSDSADGRTGERNESRLPRQLAIRMPEGGHHNGHAVYLGGETMPGGRYNFSGDALEATGHAGREA